MIEFFLNKKVFVNLITILMIAFGITAMLQLKRASYPDVEFDILKITTTYPGASAEDVEINVTEKLEDEIETVVDLDRTISNSLENLSIIYVWVDPDAQDPDEVKDEVRRAVDRVQDLPSVVEKPLIDELKSSNVSVVEIAISGEADESILRKVARDLEDEIKEVDGVGSVEKVGYRKQEVQVLLDPEHMEANYVSIGEVITAIANRNIRASGGTLESFTNEKKIVTFSEFENPLDVKDVIVRKNFQGNNLRLADFSRVDYTYEDFDVITRSNKRRSINLQVRSQANADIIDISQDINKIIAQKKTVLPKDVNVSMVIDFSYYTETLLGIVQANAVYGFFLVLIVLFIFLNRYTALWTAVGIPVSLFGAFALFPFFDININFITLITLVLVLGMLVDDAIVVAENISRHRETGMSAREAAIKGTREVMWPVVVTVATTIVAFLSLKFMGGVTGKFVREIPVVVILALSLSLFECLFLMPSHITESPVKTVQQSAWFARVKERYGELIKTAIQHRLIALAVFCLFFVSGLTLVFAKIVPFELFPYDDVDVIYVVAELPDGHSLEQTSDKMREVENIVDQISRDVLVNHTTTIGHHDRDVYGVTAGLRNNWGMMTLYLKPAQYRDTSSKKIMEDLEKKLGTLKGFEKLELDKFNDGPPVGRPITITYVSSEDALRRRYAKETFEFLKKMPGVLNVDQDEKMGKEELLLVPDYPKMAELGVTSRDLAETIRAAYNGVVATEITREGEEIDFRVQLTPEMRRRTDVLKDLPIMNPQGRLIKIGSFTKMLPSKGYEAVRHYNGKRSITVTADVDPAITTGDAVNTAIRDEFLQRIEKEPGIRMIFGGAEKESQESIANFGVALIWSLIIIYFILVMLFNSFVQPLIIVAIVPFGLAGVAYTFFTFGMPISFLCIIGTLGLIGVMVNDSLVMVSHLNNLRLENNGLDLSVLIEGCQDRLRPVILTTITTMMGLTPTILGIGGYEPFIVPLVLALAGGLFFATPITLVLVPILYSFGVRKVQA